MFLREFTLTNFLSHRNSTLRLRPLSVLVGPCNSGKSAIFDGLINFSMLARGRISLAFGAGPFSFHATRCRLAGGNASIGFEATMAQAPGSPENLVYSISYRQQPGHQDEPRYEILSERLEQRDGTVQKTLYDRATEKFDPALAALSQKIQKDTGVLAAIRQGAGVNNQLATYVAENVSRVAKYRMQSYLLRQPSDVPEVGAAARLSFKGDGLASLLFQIQQNTPESMERLAGVLRQVVPGFEGFEFHQARVQEIGFSARFSDGRGVVSSGRLSDGTLQFIGLAALLINSEKPRLLCLEEPEIGLNSFAMRQLVKLLKTVTEGEQPAVQVLLSTHSPYLLRELWREGVAEPLDSVLYLKIDQGQSKVVPARELLAVNHFNPEQMSISFAADLLDGRVNLPL